MDKPTVMPPEVGGKLRQLKRVVISFADFKHARRVADYILDEDLHSQYGETDNLLLPALNCSMIMSYCRPFSGNDSKSNDRVPDLPGRLLRVLDDRERHVHEIVMWDRNKLLAHSDSDAVEMDLKLIRVGSITLLAPVRSRGMEPLKKVAAQTLRSAIGKLEDATLKERDLLEQELRPYLPLVDTEELLD